MKKVFKAVQVSANVWWVGASDWNVRNFHGYLTDRGSTYNAFLIIDDKVTLVDTVKAPFADEMLARIASVIEPEKIDYIISNHAEPDHSSALPAVAAAVTFLVGCVSSEYMPFFMFLITIRVRSHRKTSRSTKEKNTKKEVDGEERSKIRYAIR
jgi:flavorubredoxin